MTKPTQIIFPPSDRATIDAARSKTGETFSAFVRRSALFLAHQEASNLPRPADAQDVPVIASPEEWRVTYRSASGEQSTETFRGTMAEVMRAYDSFIYIENVVTK